MRSPLAGMTLDKCIVLWIGALTGCPLCRESPRMRVNSALGQVGLSQVGPGQLGPVYISALFYLPTFFIRDAIMRCVLYIKCSAKVEGIMIGSIYIVGLSILFHLKGRLHNGKRD